MPRSRKGAQNASYRFDAAARQLAQRGWPVFPLQPGDKKPLTAHGFKDATINQAAIRKWGSEHKTANVGIATGAAGLLILDADDIESLKALETEHERLPSTLRVKTSADREQLYFNDPRGVNGSVGKLGKGLDIRARGNYVVAPPSLHPDGHRYAWVDPGAEVADAPDWLLDLCQAEREVVSDYEPSGYPLTGKQRRELYEEEWPAGEQRAYLERFTRLLIDENQLSRDDMVEDLFNALDRSPQSKEPWRIEEVEFMVDDFIAKPPQPKAKDSKAKAEQRESIAQRLNPIDLSETWDEDDEPEWLVDGIFLKGKYHEFVGEMGTGKSMLLLALIVHECFPNGIRVAYLDEENGPAEIKRRLRALGATPEDVSKYFLYLPDVMPTLKESGEIVPMIAAMNVDLVCFDSLADFYSSAGLDEDSNREATTWSKAYPELLAHAHGVATVAIDHVGHSDKSRARGASAKGAKAEATWMVELEKDERFDAENTAEVQLIRGRKNRQGVLPEKHRFMLGGDGEGNVVFKHLRTRTTIKNEKKEKEQSFRELVEEVLADGELSQIKLTDRLNDLGFKAERKWMNDQLAVLAKAVQSTVQRRKGAKNSWIYFVGEEA